MQIKITKLTDDELKSRDIRSWPTWTKDVSEFDWHYDEPEQCFFLEGKVEVTAYGKTWAFGKGDFVEFPRGMDCRWKILEAVRKHYNFG